MLAVSRPQLRSVRHCASGDQGIRDLDSRASSVLLQINACLTTHFFVDWSACQRPEKIVQGVILIRPSTGPEFSYTHGRIQDSTVGVTQAYPLGDDLRISTASDFNQDVGIDENGHRLRSRSSRSLRRRLRTYSTASRGLERRLRIPTNSCIAFICSSRLPR